MRHITRCLVSIVMIGLGLSLGLDHAYAEAEAGKSADLTSTQVNKRANPQQLWVDECTSRLSRYLGEKGPMLAPFAPIFAQEAVENNLDCSLVVAIAGQESAFGRHMAVAHNAWGWCGGKRCGFNTWEEAIQTVSKTLNEKYCKRWNACNDPYLIARYYAQDPQWPHRVEKFMRDINSLPDNPPKLSL